MNANCGLQTNLGPSKVLNVNIESTSNTDTMQSNPIWLFSQDLGHHTTFVQ